MKILIDFRFVVIFFLPGERPGVPAIYVRTFCACTTASIAASLSFSLYLSLFYIASNTWYRNQAFYNALLNNITRVSDLLCKFRKEFVWRAGRIVSPSVVRGLSRVPPPLRLLLPIRFHDRDARSIRWGSIQKKKRRKNRLYKNRLSPPSLLTTTLIDWKTEEFSRERFVKADR